MEKYDIGYIFLYVAAFGFSDYLVECLSLKGIWYLLFYVIILCIGIVLVREPLIETHSRHR